MSEDIQNVNGGPLLAGNDPEDEGLELGSETNVNLRLRIAST